MTAESSTSPALSNVVVIIPALNEEASIPLVLHDIPPVAQVIVVNNGSIDGTADAANHGGAHVVDESMRGYGAACLRGLAELDRLIAEGQPVPEIIVFVDADYSDHPDELPGLIAPIVAGEVDFVVGSRLTGHREDGAMPPQSRYGNVLACFLIKCLFGFRYTDLGPFRAIRYECLKQLQMRDTNFGWTVEMQIKAVRHGLRVAEVPVSYRRRIGVSKISGTVMGTIKAGYKILYLIARYGIFGSARAGVSSSSQV